ncbi:MAG TPA: hypothetical protein VH092_14505 [Urbifossiella sp.]|jgi:hypothetical protein|nr:hypothetical protein [Urbifossiella sp.]
MRVKLIAAAGWVLGVAAGAAAQPYGPNGGFPGGGGGFQSGSGFGYQGLNPSNVMPNIYNPQNQPLSPYLNLLRGGNSGVNYYYGVRPGTVGGGAMFGAAGLAAGGNRPTSFPFQYTQDDPLILPEPGEGYVLPPAGHPVVFNNTLGYFPYSFGNNRGRGNGGQGGFGGGQGGFGGGQQRSPTPTPKR